MCISVTVSTAISAISKQDRCLFGEWASQNLTMRQSKLIEIQSEPHRNRDQCRLCRGHLMRKYHNMDLYYSCAGVDSLPFIHWMWKTVDKLNKNKVEMHLIYPKLIQIQSDPHRHRDQWRPCIRHLNVTCHNIDLYFLTARSCQPACQPLNAKNVG